jgi:hypothetical protein
MNRATSLQAATGTLAQNAINQPRRIGKFNRSSTIGVRDEPSRPALSTRSGRRDRRKTFQSDTHSQAPLWNGSVPRPAFAAQALAQVMSDRRRDFLALAVLAYRHTILQPSPALRLDVHV